MENTKLNRINELAALAKQRELTAEELAERDTLRREYIAEWRRGAEQVLENTWIVTPDGKKTKLRKRGEPSSSSFTTQWTVSLSAVLSAITHWRRSAAQDPS